jgi:hypothetical protein
MTLAPASVRYAAGFLGLALAAACAPGDGSADRETERGSEVDERSKRALSAGAASLYVDPADFDFSENPDLLDRLLADPHGYFRFINVPFSRRVCDLFADQLTALSSEQARSFQLNLHGDAHVEQYAITDLGRGLTDFDDSSQGPPFLDLMRFAVSLRLASRINSWDEVAEEELVRTFLRGYSSALEDPAIEATEPAVIERLRSSFSQDTPGYLTWVDSLMEPVPPEVESELHDALRSFAEAMVEEHPEVDRDYFAPVRLGYLTLGVGSALDTKFIVRVAGPSPDPMDDDVIEIKRVRDLAGIDCIQTQDDDPLRVLLSQARISYEPFQWLGYIRLAEGNFWTHGWVHNYEEIDIDRTFRSPDELAEVAFDAGVQLGIGHPKLAATPFDQILRRQLLEHLDAHTGEIERLSAELADQVNEAWSRFASDVRSGVQPDAES